MSYVKHQWQTGDIVTATKLNEMEDGLQVAGEVNIATTSESAIEIADGQGHVALQVDLDGNLRTGNFDSRNASGVEVNPSEAATATASKLKVNGTTYDLQGSNHTYDAISLQQVYVDIYRKYCLSTQTYPIKTIKGNVLVVGDSTISGTNCPARIGIRFLPVQSGYTLSDISKGGDTIQGQTNLYNALSAEIKAGLNYAFIQIGLNDVNRAMTAETFKGKVQSLINSIKTNAPNCMVVLACMLPCRTRWDQLHPGQGPTYHALWQAYNQDIINGTYTNVDHYACAHVEALAGNNYSLRAEYDTGDKIHENEEGQKLIAFSWLAAAFSAEATLRA